MTNLERLSKMNANDMAKFIMQLIRDGEFYDYNCGNCPATNCGNFEPEERCCWGTIMKWLEEEAE